MAGLVALVAAPLPATARQTQEEALVQRLDSLAPLLKEARQRAMAARERQRLERDSKTPTETVRVGPLRVLVVPGEEAAALDVVGGVWNREYASWVDGSPSLERDRIFFQWAVTPTDYASAYLYVRKVQGSRWERHGYMETGVRQVISESLKSDLQDHRLWREWVPTAIRMPQRPDDVYRQVALLASQSARACLAGSATGCLESFGLVGDDTPLDEWYTPQERRLLVRGQLNRFVRGHPEGVVECRDGGLAECDRLLQGFWDQWPRLQDRLWAVPFQAEVRNSLLWYALEQGGEGAWSRLLAHPDASPLEALEAASGLTGEQLAAGWHGWLLENRPERHAGLGSMALGSLFWITLLIAFAARSSRWRFG
jgi:hypothetical protein